MLLFGAIRAKTCLLSCLEMPKGELGRGGPLFRRSACLGFHPCSLFNQFIYFPTHLQSWRPFADFQTRAPKLGEDIFFFRFERFLVPGSSFPRPFRGLESLESPYLFSLISQACAHRKSCSGSGTYRLIRAYSRSCSLLLACAFFKLEIALPDPTHNRFVVYSESEWKCVCETS